MSQTHSGTQGLFPPGKSVKDCCLFSCLALCIWALYPHLAVVTPPTRKNNCSLCDCTPKGCNSLSGSAIKQSLKTHQIGPHRDKVNPRSLLLNQTVRLCVSIFRFLSFWTWRSHQPNLLCVCGTSQTVLISVWSLQWSNQRPLEVLFSDLIVKKKRWMCSFHRRHWPFWWAGEKKHSAEELDRWATTLSRRSASTGMRKHGQLEQPYVWRKHCFLNDLKCQ